MKSGGLSLAPVPSFLRKSTGLEFMTSKKKQKCIDSLFWEAISFPGYGLRLILRLAQDMARNDCQTVLNMYCGDERLRRELLEKLMDHIVETQNLTIDVLSDIPTCVATKSPSKTPEVVMSNTTSSTRSTTNASKQLTARFNAAGFNRHGHSFLRLWQSHTREDDSEQDVKDSFQLIKRNGGVTLAHALSFPNGSGRFNSVNFYGFVLTSGNEFALDTILSEPELRPGWNVVCTTKCRSTPLIYALSISFGDSNATRIVHVSDDETINAVDANFKSALFYAVVNQHLEALYALLCRPSLDMNPLFSVRHAMDKLNSVGQLESVEDEIIDVFDQAAAVFAGVPYMIRDSVYAFTGIRIPLSLCDIVAQYYRMPYPHYEHPEYPTDKLCVETPAPAPLKLHPMRGYSFYDLVY